MVSAHDEDTDYSDLDEAPADEVPAQRQTAPKNRDRASERTPLLSSSPPPPAYSDVTRLYGAPPYASRGGPSGGQPHQRYDDSTIESGAVRSDQPQSMGDTRQDSENRKQIPSKRRILSSLKILTCLMIIVAAAAILVATVGARHDNGNHKQKEGNENNTSPPVDSFPHLSQCNYDYISNPEVFGFPSTESFSFVEITEGSHSGPSYVRGQIRLLPGNEDQEEDIMTQLRVAKSPEVHSAYFRVDYFSQSLRLRTPALSSTYSRACMEIDVTIWIKPRVRLEHFEVISEHLDIKIEPGLFPSSGISGFGDDDDASYISNTTDFVAVSGDLSAAYWASGRETRIDLTSGSISGRFALRDLLSVKTRSGNIDVNVEPKSACKAAPKPAEFIALTNSGSIRVTYPISSASGDIPERIYHSNIDSTSGSISGDLIHGLSTDISTSSGSIDVNILPYSADDDRSRLQTETQGGMTKINLLAPFKDPENSIKRLRSLHKTRSGSLNVKYPQQWEGKLEAVTMTGSIGLHGKDIRELKRWKGPVGAHVIASKGSGSSAMDVGTSSGSVDVTIGDVY